jgi:hypothetical protein
MCVCSKHLFSRRMSTWRFHEKTRNFLRSWATTSFTMKTLFREVWCVYVGTECNLAMHCICQLNIQNQFCIQWLSTKSALALKYSRGSVTRSSTCDWTQLCTQADHFCWHLSFRYYSDTIWRQPPATTSSARLVSFYMNAVLLKLYKSRIVTTTVSHMWSP